MKASLIILTGASTVSATWFPNWCCGGFPSPDQPQTTTTVTTTTTTIAATNIPAPTSTELGLSGIYPASSIYREPTTLSTSIIPTKSSDAGSIPIDEDLTFEVDPVTDAGITVYPESVPPESVHIPDNEDLTFEADPPIDAGITVSPTEVSQSIYPESVHISDNEEADGLLDSDSESDSDSGPGSDSNSNPVVDPDSELKRIAKETNSKLDATNLRLENIIQGFKDSGARMQALIEKARKLNNPEGVPDNSEVKDEIPDEEEFSFPILPQTTDPGMGNGDSASSQTFGEDFDDASGCKNTENQYQC
ncbi:LisH domain-containing protein [Ceratocystis lukuohia]|uniref:LisH domain-containing protein n=1 Tax=Ceratocystis lukuohia TaxID=2019550 RepID=A0ABR4MGS1_9PEZI